MPSIDVAMARSVQPSAFEKIGNAMARGITAELVRRNIIADGTQKITDIKTALSSWDNCMSVAWCQWPVIGIIVVGGLIIFSIVWCIIRCCCCGLSCCCSCCQCLKCCGNCCGCCDPPGDRKHKHLDDPYAPETNHHAYRSEPPMQPSAQPTIPQSSNTQFAPQPQHWHNEPPKYAEVEVRSGKHNDEDALPEMPTMEKAETMHKVGLHDDVELDQLKKSPIQEQQQYGMMNGTPSTMPQGRSPYGQQQQGNHSGYFNQGQAPDPYSPIDKGYGGYQTNQGGDYGHDQAYATGAAGAASMGRHSPGQNYNGFGQNQAHGADQGYGRDGYGELDGYSNAAQGYGARQSPGPSRTPAPQELNGYGYGVAPSRSPAPQNSYDDYHQSARKTPALQDAYGYGQNNQQAAYDNRHNSPAPEPHYGPRPVPQRQYPQQDPPRSPLNNNAGFDFNSGYARTGQSPTTESYPGYKAYQP